MAQVEPLPLVPATCTKRQLFCGRPSAVQHGANAIQAELGAADFVAERVEELNRIGVVHNASSYCGGGFGSSARALVHRNS